MTNRSIRNLMLGIAISMISLPAWASLSISTQPLFVTTATPPNIVVALDNSGSMASAFVPDSLDDATSLIVYEYYNPNTSTTGTTTTSATVIVTAGTVNNGTVAVGPANAAVVIAPGVVNTSAVIATSAPISGSVIVTTGAVNTTAVNIASAPISGTLTVTTGTVNHVAVTITGPSGGKYTYSCASGYTLNPSSPTKGTSSTAAGYSCDQQTYNYSCASGFNLSGPSSGTSSSGSGSSCSKPNYNYSCPSGYTLNPSSPTSGSSSTASGYTCQQQTYNYSCASGFNLSPASPTSGTSSTGSGYTCSKPNYNYSCSSGYTLSGPTSGSSNSPTGTTCTQQIYNYSCPSGYNLTPSSPTTGTSSIASGYSCPPATYTYSCAAGYTLSGSSTGTTSTPPSGTKCTQQTYNYSCPSGYTRNGSSTGTVNPAPSSVTCTKTTTATTYSCPAGMTASTTDNTDSTMTCAGYSTQSVQGEQSVMFKAATYNPLAYDPGISYAAPFKADGTLYSTSFTTAYFNGYDTTRGNVNLYTSYQVTVNYDPSSTGQTTNDCDGTFGTKNFSGTISKTSCHNNTGGIPAYYYVYNASNSGCTTATNTAGQSIDSRCYTYVPVNATSGPGGTDERQNFANWFSFYRTRNLTTVSAADRAFAQLSSTMRVAWIDLSGCTTFSSSSCADWAGNTFDNRIAQFTGTHRSSFFNWLSRLPANTNTPLRTMLQSSGNYFKTTGVNSPYAEQPQVTDGTEFVCRPNYTVLMTDGLWNQDTITSYGNTDNTAATLPDGTAYTTNRHPYSDSNLNSLADIAYYYWATNLRSDLGTSAALQYMPYTKNVSVVDSVNGTASLIPYWNPQNDPATWPHMNTFTVGLGMTTTLTSPKWNGNTFTGTGYGDVVTGHVAWPAVSSDSANNVYDLWHAAINSRGQFFSADSPQDVANAFNTIVSRITGRVGSSAAIAVNSTRLDSNTFIYQGQFNSGDWSGEVLAFKINSDGSIPANATWLGSQHIPAAASRNILSWDDTANAGAGGGIVFQYANMNSTEKALLDKNISGVTDNQGSDRVAYLRGDQSKEQSQSGGIYRNRADLLADIVDSNPLFVGSQNFGFNNLPGSEGASYSSFVASKSTRTETLMVGANDGMLHGLNAGTGAEVFAYVPRGIYGKLSALTDPLYTHQFYVDGSPQTVDAYINGTWKSLLLGTTGAGGREIFLIDASNPAALTSSNILWDYDGAIRSDADMGYSLPQPTIARMHDGNWYVIFGNGYNSPNGHAVLYMYRISDGTILKFDTGVGTDNGMSAPNPVDYGGDRITDAIYSGDLHGNIWKLDVSSASPANWKYFIYATSGTTPTPLFTAMDSSNNPQPITDRPQVGLNSSGQVMVFFGTGTYFLSGDNAVPNNPPVQTFYGIIDDLANTATDQVLRSNLTQQQVVAQQVVNGTNTRVTTNYPLSSGAQGWYINLDFPNAQGERVVSDSVLDNGRIVFTTVIPQGAACQYGGTSWLMELNIDNGGQLSISPLDINGDGKVNSNDYVKVTYTDPKTNQSVTVTVPVSGEQSNVGIIKTPAIIQAGNIEIKFFSGSTGQRSSVIESTGSSGGRESWQQVQ